MRPVLVVHHGTDVGRVVSSYLRVEDFEVTQSTRVTSALAKVSRTAPHLIVVDVTPLWPTQADLRLLLRSAGHAIPVLRLVPQAEHSRTLREQLIKPFSLETLGASVRTLLEVGARPPTAPAPGGMRL